ncbi:hypothetical protein TKK_0013442 [Trichogramma kaykai]|uniref:F-box domain-containing protein n=1 Tax=Trichogramma kaykai TaxID=54128 RepID=A0ABD2WIC3_9HYME
MAQKTLDVELILFDILDDIFKYLSLKDLYQVALVCKSWNNTASKEISRRSDIENFILPITRTKDNSQLSMCHLTDAVRSFPRLVLLFSDGKSPPCDDIEDICVYQCKCMERKTNFINIAAQGIAVNDTQIVGQDNVEVGITIPYPNKINKLKIDYFLPEDEVLLIHKAQNSLESYVKDAYKDLVTSEEDHNCFIFFYSQSCLYTENCQRNSYIRKFTADLLTCIKQRHSVKTFTLWGGEISSIITDFMGRDGILASSAFYLRLSGPGVKSWSLVIDSNAPNSEVKTRFEHLKKQLSVNRTTMALAMVPSKRDEPFEQLISKVSMFRTAFPGIPLTTIFTGEEFFQIGFNSTNTEDPDPVLEHENSYSFLIFTTK